LEEDNDINVAHRPQPTTTPGYYTTCCKSQSYAPEDGQKVARNMLS